jgi:hypothetical protein
MSELRWLETCALTFDYTTRKVYVLHQLFGGRLESETCHTFIYTLKQRQQHSCAALEGQVVPNTSTAPVQHVFVSSSASAISSHRAALGRGGSREYRIALTITLAKCVAEYEALSKWVESLLSNERSKMKLRGRQSVLASCEKPRKEVASAPLR